MSFVQNFPFFSIILSLACAVVSFAANARWARRLHPLVDRGPVPPPGPAV